jgi:hypothetical protein
LFNHYSFHGFLRNLNFSQSISKVLEVIAGPGGLEGQGQFVTFDVEGLLPGDEVETPLPA